MILVAIRDSLSELSLSSHCSKNSQFSILNSQFLSASAWPPHAAPHSAATHHGS